jgi:hypothetical protein
VLPDHDAIVFEWHDRQSSKVGANNSYAGIDRGTLKFRKESVPDAIRAFGLYFSEIREFDSKSVPPE